MWVIPVKDPRLNGRGWRTGTEIQVVQVVSFDSGVQSSSVELVAKGEWFEGEGVHKGCSCY